MGERESKREKRWREGESDEERERDGMLGDGVDINSVGGSSGG